MSQIKFITGAKEDIPAKYLDQLMNLFQENYKEILLQEPPDVQIYRNMWKLGDSSDQKNIYTIVLNQEDQVIGYGHCSWNIKYDNLNKGYFWIHIAKEERRKGYGKRTLIELLSRYPTQVTDLFTEVFSHTAGVPFVESFQMEKKYTEVLSQSDLTNFDLVEVKKESKKLKKAALEKGYEIIYIDNLDHVFHLEFKKYVAMLEEIWNDMPLEELTFEDEILDIARYQEMLKRQILMGYDLLTFVAIHKETNNPVGMTMTYITKFQPHLGLQQDTGVIRSHRGKRLGLTLKYQMLEKLLTDTKITKWQTGNAGSNEHMLRINEVLNHEPFVEIPIYEMKTSDLKRNL
jgi:hypothetical protein